LELTVDTESPVLADAITKAVAQQRIWLTTEDIAERFRTTPGTVRYWKHISYGPSGVRIGRRTLYDLAEVERWEAERVAKATA
jgi:hypothetical protein